MCVQRCLSVYPTNIENCITFGRKGEGMGDEELGLLVDGSEDGPNYGHASLPSGN